MFRKNEYNALDAAIEAAQRFWAGILCNTRVKEAALEAYLGQVKSKTTKPVVSVGRFTSPDTMVSQLKRGVMDFIGAARPSIADPFLPNKIAEGRIDDIRECIGCNICYTGDSKHYPIRCTQNPTTGEEWRRGWHPENINPKGASDQVLIVGAGPAGLEAARALAQRGYQVMLAEAGRELGGRVSAESRLPGLSEWARVRDYRVSQINKMPNVDVYFESELTLADVLEVGAQHVAIATGARWRADGYGSYRTTAMYPMPPAASLYTADDIMSGRTPNGPTIVYDDDGFYMASVIAELLQQQGCEVTYVTPASKVSAWSVHNAEQPRVHKKLFELGVDIVLNHGLEGFDGNQLQASCVNTGQIRTITAENLVLVTCRLPQDTLFNEVTDAKAGAVPGAPETVVCIGDADAPSIIATAVYAGHKYARELDLPMNNRIEIHHDLVTVNSSTTVRSRSS